MRVVVRAMGLSLALLACGRAQGGGSDDAQGGGGSQDGGATATAATSNGGSSRGGVSTGIGGVSSQGGASPGGAPPSGGSPSLGGSSSGLGGAVGSGGIAGGDAGSGGAAMAGSAGASGAGGTSSCDDYLACGCVCCDTPPTVPTACYYPEVAGDVEGVIAANEAERLEKCELPGGCTRGALYTCCESGPPDTDPESEYSVVSFFGALDRIQIVKSGFSSCARINLVKPGSAPNIRMALALPQGWFWEDGWAENCSMSASPTWTIGAIGSVNLVWDGQCRLDAHLTLFSTVNDVVSKIRFDVDSLPVGLDEPQCL